MKKPKKPSEYEKTISHAPIKGLFSMPSKTDKSMKKKKSIFGKS